MKTRFCLWLMILLYVAALPYAIVPFDYLRNVFTLEGIRIIPLILLLGMVLVYIRFCRIKEEGYHLLSFGLPCVVLLLGVLTIETNPIKYLHVPEYLLLTFLVYLGLSQEKRHRLILVAAVIYACVFGLIDEVHQGMHPERYFGWKDMLINAAGSLIGGLFLNLLHPTKSISLESLKVLVAQRKPQMTLLFFSVIVTTYSTLTLFSVAASSSFYLSYPLGVLTANTTIIAWSIFLALVSVPLIKTSLEFRLLLYWPILMLALFHCLVVFAFSKDIKFQ